MLEIEVSIAGDSRRGDIAAEVDYPNGKVSAAN
jgi:hypothetical protein